MEGGADPFVFNLWARFTAAMTSRDAVTEEGESSRDRQGLDRPEPSCRKGARHS
ncbi:hypothetical protein CPCC7001_2645 [Cyanobium sp. PCC 7001]|nr:hypothetical protein CPCC7001_2645 [Cyanobium sp. PCC 7001]